MYKYDSFDDAMKRLEEIVKALEAGDCKLEEASRLFAEGVELAAECNSRIDTARQSIVKLSQLTSDGDETYSGK